MTNSNDSQVSDSRIITSVIHEDEENTNPLKLIQNGPNIISMTSLEIAELLQCRHDNLKRSIERLVVGGAIVRPPMADVRTIDSLNRQRTSQVFVFEGHHGRLDAITVVAQNNPIFTAALVERWDELERNKNKTSSTDRIIELEDLTNRLEKFSTKALRLLVEECEKNETLQLEDNQVKTERDEAIRTKAWINEKRMATTMGRLSVANRKIQKLEAENFNLKAIIQEQLNGA